MSGFIDLTGVRFSRLTVVKRAPEKTLKVRWVCECDCGNQVTVISANLKNGNTQSCGCQRTDSSRTNGLNRRKHGMTGTPEYKAWQGLRDRCYNEDAEQYPNYGGRGVSVCKEWLNSFEAFYADMGPRPEKGYSIDRVDVNGDYEPSNCRWATGETQSNNKRCNKYFILDGERLTLSQIARKYKIPLATLTCRVYRDGLSIETAVAKKANQRLAHYNGVSKRLHEWAAELNIPYLKLYRHVTTVSPDLKELIGE